MMCIVLPVLLLVLAMEFGGINIAMRLQVGDARLLNAELVDTIGKNFDEMNQSVKSLLNLITMDEELQELLERGERLSTLWTEDNREIKSIVSDKTLLIDNIEAIYLYGSDGLMRTFWHRKTSLGWLPLYDAIDESWCDPSGRVSSRRDGEHLLYVRRIRSMDTLANIGYCLMIYDRQAFGVQFEATTRLNGRMVIVKDGDGRIVTHNGSDDADIGRIAAAVEALGVDFEGSTDLPHMGRAIVAQYVSPQNGWRTLSVVPVGQIVRSSSMLVRMMLSLGVVCMALGAGICALLVRRLIGRPIRSIMEAMRRVDEGDYTQRLSIHTGDELEDLAGSINEMLSRTDNLINQVLRDKLLHKELQLAALQAQINPHLLHNALESVNWLAEFGRKEDIRLVTLSLSRLMQSLTDAPQLVTLEEELDYTRCFLSVYEILLEKRLSWSIDTQVAPGLMIPRLTIQPLVENAVIHGIKRSLTPGHIDISVSNASEGVLICVFDDGAGMDADKVRAVNDFARGEGDGTGLGVGLRNVIERLRLLYGERASLRCASDPSCGTLIDLVLPYARENAEDGGEPAAGGGR